MIPEIYLRLRIASRSLIDERAKSSIVKPENGYSIDFKVFVEDLDSKDTTHEIHVQAKCADFVPKHLYVNGIKFSYGSK
ncbi:unnamed protein product [Gongylonema pulchrum]|uniref:Wzt_C domain-containing protein n=1 Tax=Gongylonema pulchrum TaxID=637853 RepID=A0A183EWE3_9BILA|nr:unnamed protein product [Gongylonema pulchrum]